MILSRCKNTLIIESDANAQGAIIGLVARYYPTLASINIPNGYFTTYLAEHAPTTVTGESSALDVAGKLARTFRHRLGTLLKPVPFPITQPGSSTFEQQFRLFGRTALDACLRQTNSRMVGFVLLGLFRSLRLALLLRGVFL